MYFSKFDANMREMFVVFTWSQLDMCKRFLNPEYGHCGVAQRADGGHFIALNPWLDRLNIEEFFEDIKSKPGFKVVKVVMSPKNYYKLRLGIFSCVGVTKYILGLRKCWALTPYGLYKFLTRLKPNQYHKHNILSVEVL